MGNFKYEFQTIEGLCLITPKVYGDERGYNMETYHYKDFKDAGINAQFVQDNISMSRKGVLRGLHFQKTHPQGKLVRVIKGTVFDVAVDLRKDSPTYGNWHSEVLSDENKKMFYIPEGFAHGFLVLSEEAIFSYKLTDFYHPEDEGGILWCDKDINVEWPVVEGIDIVVSEKDNQWPAFSMNKFAF